MADRGRRLDPLFAGFGDGLQDFTPFFPLDGIIWLVDTRARDGLLLIGDAGRTMSPAGAIGVNVALATGLLPALLLLLLRSPLLPRMQRRLFFGAPLPPLDPAVGFRS